ncbi:MAG TPA: Fic family protein [Actinomycetota bacterium]
MLFSAPALSAEEQQVLERIDELRKSLRYATAERRRWTGLLRRVLFARNIRGSNSIEGYEVSLDDALSIALMEDEESLDAEQETKAAVIGYRNAMTYILQIADDPHFFYSEGLIKSLHFMMLHYALDKSPGRWRPGVIYVRDDDTGQIVYEGPDAIAVPGLMAELVDDLNAKSDVPAMVRAAMAHLNLAMVHPFRDGNGRMARALQTLVLAREGILVPEFASIEEYLGRNTPAYYDVLAEVGRGAWHPESDARPWVRFTLTAHYRQARTVQERISQTEHAWNLLESLAKQQRLPERVVSALYLATVGFRVRNAMYRIDADVSDLVATKDLAALVDRGLLEPRGERRGRFYVAAAPLIEIRSEIDSRRKPIEDPFRQSG